MRSVEHELSPDRLASIDESILRYLGSLAGKHPERFCPEPPLYKLSVTAYCSSYDVLLGRLRHLEEIGRIVPASSGEQLGWFVRLGREWRKAHRQRKVAPPPKSVADGFTSRDREFLRQCGIVS